jgi:Glycine transporter
MLFDTAAAALDWLGVIVFAISGALVASRKQMDVVGFALLGWIDRRLAAARSATCSWAKDPCSGCMSPPTSSFV